MKFVETFYTTSLTKTNKRITVIKIQIQNNGDISHDIAIVLFNVNHLGY